MNYTLISPIMWQAFSYNEHSSSLCLTHLEALTPLDLGEISGGLTDFSSENVALRSVIGTEEGDALHVDLPSIAACPALQRKQFFIWICLTWKHPRRWIEVIFQVT